jgi:hypothetical protein
MTLSNEDYRKGIHKIRKSHGNRKMLGYRMQQALNDQ